MPATLSHQPFVTICWVNPVCLRKSNLALTVLTNKGQLLLPAADLRQERSHERRGQHGLQVQAHVFQEHGDLKVCAGKQHTRIMVLL